MVRADVFSYTDIRKTFYILSVLEKHGMHPQWCVPMSFLILISEIFILSILSE